VEVSGTAVMNGRTLYTPVPKDMNRFMALSALDVSRAVPLLVNALETMSARKLKMKYKTPLTLFIIGCGKAGITCIVAAKKYFKGVKIMGIDVNEHNLSEAKKFISQGDVIEKVNAQNVTQVLEFVKRNTLNGEGADLVVSCVNVPNVEASAIISTKTLGILQFFSMATQFDKAALGTDGVAKQVDVMIGAGVFPQQVSMMYGLMRENKKLWEFLKKRSKAFQHIFFSFWKQTIIFLLLFF